jgi:hypothetical protein
MLFAWSAIVARLYTHNFNCNSAWVGRHDTFNTPIESCFFACFTCTHALVMNVHVVGIMGGCTSEFAIGAYLPLVLNFRFLR